MVKQYQLILLPILLVASIIASASLKPWRSVMKSEEVILAPTLIKVKPSKRFSGLRNPRFQFTRVLNSADSKKMWTKNLFNPDREESEVIAGKGGTITKNDTMYDFELVGLSLIGETGGRATIITTRKSTINRYGRRTYRPRRASKGKNKSTRPNKNYRVGAMIKEGEADTGFRLTSVEIDHVILTRKNQRLKVELKRGGSAAVVRRKAEAKAQVAALKKMPPKGKIIPAVSSNKLTPPPPPPMPVPNMKMPSRGGKTGNRRGRK